eukprot:12634664-Heterocapsa_arctica.AAC.1
MTSGRARPAFRAWCPVWCLPNFARLVTSARRSRAPLGTARLSWRRPSARGAGRVGPRPRAPGTRPRRPCLPKTRRGRASLRAPRDWPSPGGGPPPRAGRGRPLCRARCPRRMPRGG